MRDTYEYMLNRDYNTIDDYFYIMDRGLVLEFKDFAICGTVAGDNVPTIPHEEQIDYLSMRLNNETP